MRPGTTIALAILLLAILAAGLIQFLVMTR
ncbi:MAG: hypothetical protein QOK43_3273 [Acidimicrobiaceae bacterium]|jgi:hypothetical protein|nr:hypothetical protein [Acidimicrobiaceae bacterium]MDQ1445155.1 hypothetical protein [Acidimicrobiaceae bacterium]